MEGRQLARNSALNLIGLVLPLGLAVITIPPLISGLGPERFGILTLAWAAIGYFSLFEFGLGRAITLTVARELGRGSVEGPGLATILWTATGALVVLGLVAGVLVAVLAPVLVAGLLNVPEQLQGETVRAFQILGISLPFVVMTVGLRGIMEGHQHFGAVTALRIPLAAVTFIGPLLVLPFSRSLVASVTALAIGRLLGWIAHLAYCLGRYPYLRSKPSFSLPTLMPLLRVGGWMTVSNVVSPLMVVMDRFFIAAILPLVAVAHYVTPFEIVVKLLVIPGAIVAALFPAFASTSAAAPARLRQLYDRSLRVVVLAMYPIVLVTMAFAPEGLDLWLGGRLPAASSDVLRWLALGVFINAIGHVPFAALQAARQPEIVARVHLVELPIYAGLLWGLASTMGLVGVAIAWTLRVALDAAALLVLSELRLPTPTQRSRDAFLAVGPMVLSLAAVSLLDDGMARAIVMLAALAALLPLAWRKFFTAAERDGWRRLLRRERRVTKPDSAGAAGA